MMNHVFSIAEAENLFEIGRSLQYFCDKGAIEIEDSREAFFIAVNLAQKFEKEHPESDDYYGDIDEFIKENLLMEFGSEC